MDEETDPKAEGSPQRTPQLRVGAQALDAQTLAGAFAGVGVFEQNRRAVANSVSDHRLARPPVAQAATRAYGRIGAVSREATQSDEKTVSPLVGSAVTVTLIRSPRSWAARA